MSSSVYPFDYPLKSIHFLVATKNHTALSETISSLPRLDDPLLVNSIKVSTAQEEISDSFSSTLNSRDNDKRDTPLHIAVRLKDLDSVKILLSVAGGADVTLPNAKGWTPFEEAVLRHSSATEIIKLLVTHQRQMIWYKWRRRLPLVSKTLKDDVPDFFLQITVGMECTVFPVKFPTQTIKVWKQGGNFVVDTPVLSCFEDLTNPALFSRLKRKRIVFISAGEIAFLMKNVDGKKEERSKAIDLIEKMQQSMQESDFEQALGQKEVNKIKMDMSKAKFVERRRKWCISRKTKDVGKWRNCKVYKGKKFGLNWFVWSKKKVYWDSEVEVVEGKVYREKNINPSIWVNDEFPLRIDALDPILSSLAGEEMRDLAIVMQLLKSTGTNSFPVKVSLPMFWTVNMVATVTAFSSNPNECGGDNLFEDPFGTGE